MSYVDNFRKSRFLKRVNPKGCPVSLLFFDTETLPRPRAGDSSVEDHFMRLYYAKHLRVEKDKITRMDDSYGQHESDFWDFVYRKCDTQRPLWMFAHNASFDLTALGFWLKILNGEIEFLQVSQPNNSYNEGGRKNVWKGCAILSDPPIIIECRWANTRRTMIIVDTLNYFRCSLERLGHDIGIEKMPMPSFDASDRLWLEYCARDVEIIKEAILTLRKLVHKENLGGWSSTIAGIAWECYRAHHLPSDRTIIIHGSHEATELERESYFGGLSQIWYQGIVTDNIITRQKRGEYSPIYPAIKGPVYHLDSSSFYPSIMRDNAMPVRLRRIHCSPPLSLLFKADKSTGFIAKVSIETDRQAFPVRKDGRTFYATGRFVTTLCGPELERAMDARVIRAIWSASEYDMEIIFKSYVDSLYQLKCKYHTQGKREMEFLIKLLMNSLYGKFAQRSRGWEDEPNYPPTIPIGQWFERDLTNGEIKLYRAMGNLVQVQTDETEGRCSVPAISSWITSIGREKIIGWRQIAGEMNSLYSDTDSIHVTHQGYLNLIASNQVQSGKLGYLRLVESADKAEYRGQKDYTFGGRDVIAGIKGSAKLVKPRVYQQKEFAGVSQIWQQNSWSSIPVTTVEIVRPDPVVPGQVDEYGWVHPVRLEEW